MKEESDGESRKKAQEIVEFMRRVSFSKKGNHSDSQNSQDEPRGQSASSIDSNPWTESGWGNKMYFWKCPRCDGYDLFRAPRQVGSIGIGREFDGFDTDADLDQAGFVLRSFQRNVLLCKMCGERALRYSRDRNSRELIRAARESNELWNSGAPYALLGFGLLIYLIVWALFLK